MGGEGGDEKLDDVGVFANRSRGEAQHPRDQCSWGSATKLTCSYKQATTPPTRRTDMHNQMAIPNSNPIFLGAGKLGATPAHVFHFHMQPDGIKGSEHYTIHADSYRISLNEVEFQIEDEVVAKIYGRTMAWSQLDLQTSPTPTILPPSLETLTKMQKEGVSRFDKFRNEVEEVTEAGHLPTYVVTDYDNIRSTIKGILAPPNNAYSDTYQLVFFDEVGGFKAGFNNVKSCIVYEPEPEPEPLAE